MQNGRLGRLVRRENPRAHAAVARRAFREKYARPATPKPLSGTIKKYQWGDGISTIVLFIESDTAEK